MKKKPSPRNKFELASYQTLRKSRVKFEYETEKIPYTIVGNYIPDFVVFTKSKKKIYIETKGHFRPEAKRKMVAVKKQHPDLDIRIVFYSRKEKDIKWAERYGFPYAIQDIPAEWLG